MKLVVIRFLFIPVMAVLLGHISVSAQTIEIGSDDIIIDFIKAGPVPGHDWLYFKGTTPDDAWKYLGYDDSDDTVWLTGYSGFGYGDGDDETVLGDMKDNYHTIYIRKVFNIASVAPNMDVQLVIDYDDGFVAYLNGELVAEHNSYRNPANNELAANHEAGDPETIPLIGKSQDLLIDGDNILAIEGLNVSLDSSDFSLIPALRAVSDSKVILTEDTTWAGTYLIKSPIVIDSSATLTIEPGSVIMLQSGMDITVNGCLLAEGTEADPIRFTRDQEGQTWERIMFVNAQDSVLRNCIIEYAGADGNHKDYYDDDCDPNTPIPSRDYKEAIVAVASHIDILDCTFQNLPNYGDALAIISDDPDNPGDSTANIVGCNFISIGQGVHTRFSYVLVEDCFFTGHDGDNDDIDLYGESDPVPLILNNRLINPLHDDMINPTKCSAILIGNTISGCDDHGVVLRDKCYPVVMNNLIYNCENGGIAIQNQCDALLVNNTIVNSAKGIKFFDHTGRWGPPYCLVPGSGKATIINCIIRDCPISFDLTDSPSTEDPGSHVTVSYCNIEGGLQNASVSSNSTITWGEGNIDEPPQFADIDAGDFHLKSMIGRWDTTAAEWISDATHSPCIDAGDPTGYNWIENTWPHGEIIRDNWMTELWPHGSVVNMGAFGGTPQASMSMNDSGSIADLNHDDIVNLEDIIKLAENWQKHHVLLDSDLDRNGIVNIADLSIFSLNWLWQAP